MGIKAKVEENSVWPRVLPRVDDGLLANAQEVCRDFCRKGVRRTAQSEYDGNLRLDFKLG